MAQLNKPFNPNEHEAMRDFSPLPEGDYLAHIVKSEMKPTKNPGGQYLQLEFQIDSPGYAERKVWTRLNLVNANSNAVEIAERELKSICDAIGTGPISDSDILHGKPLVIKLKIEPPTAQYGASNSITGYASTGTIGTQQGIQGNAVAGQGIQGNVENAAPIAEKPGWA